MAMRFTFRSRSVGVRHARVTAQRDDVNTTERLAPIFVRCGAPDEPAHPANAQGTSRGQEALVWRACPSHWAPCPSPWAPSSQPRAPPNKRGTAGTPIQLPYSPLSLSYIACPLMSQNHISLHEPRKTPAFPCKCERPPWAHDSHTLSAPSIEAITARRTCNPSVRISPPSFFCILVRGHHVHFVEKPPPPHVRRTSACSPRPRVLFAGPIGRPIGRPAPCA